ncbi:hypothetical protein L1887_35752 [Cichorium endivia]|nr:hypothetical protein L1887_35752 [Cichorium endivia]
MLGLSLFVYVNFSLRRCSVCDGDPIIRRSVEAKIFSTQSATIAFSVDCGSAFFLYLIDYRSEFFSFILLAF